MREQMETAEVESDALLNKALSKTLLSLMANSDDSNILFRKGLTVLEQFRALSGEALKKSGDGGQKEGYDLLAEFCKEKNISPGGSADLLAVTLFLFYVEKEFESVK